MKTTLDSMMESPSFQRAYAEEGFVVECLERVCELMENDGVSRAELARRLGTSRSNVTQILSGRNVSLRTIAGMSHVLGGVPQFCIQRQADASTTASTARRELTVHQGGGWRGRSPDSLYKFSDAATDDNGPLLKTGGRR